MKKIYLAGFDVFYKDAAKRGDRLKALCREYGFEGLYPLDNSCEGAYDIFKGNLGLIDRVDIICANLNDFRGDDPDSGTAFELGYGCAKGKLLYGYREDTRTLRERLGEADGKGFLVEDFSMCVNLMLGSCCKIVQGDLEDCLRVIKEDNL